MPEAPHPRFACDAMLGGLARWLRAAGYDASWHDGIDDGDLVRLGRNEGRTVLSSDDDVRNALHRPPALDQDKGRHPCGRRP